MGKNTSPDEVSTMPAMDEVGAPSSAIRKAAAFSTSWRAAVVSTRAAALKQKLTTWAAWGAGLSSKTITPPAPA